ncbi:MAG TPA: hypothetical protein VL972_03570 [Solirubrobacteraceae bacterium]|nr:hypothetical protein [Solirubrobacteraceae bacterium]
MASSVTTDSAAGAMSARGYGASPPQGRIERAADAVDRNAVWVLAGLMVLAGAMLLYMGRELTFYFDEWEWIAKDYGGGIHTLLVAHVGNISVFPVIVYKILFHLVGLDHYEVFRLAVIVLHLICGLLIYLLAVPRIGRVPGLLAATLILFLGAAWEDLLWAFQVGYLLSVSGGLATWFLLERRRRWTDVAAMLCLVVSAGSSSLGIAVMVGIGVELAWRREMRRMWIFLIPAALYALWYLAYGESQVTEASLVAAPGFAEDLAASAFGGLAGRGLDWGRPLALAGALILVWRLVRGERISARLASLVAAAIALWVVTAVARSTISPPEASRYIYLGAVLIVLIGVELLRGVEITARACAVASGLVLICVITGVTILHNGAGGLRATSQTVAAEVGAMELAAVYAPPEYRPDPVRSPQIFAGSYLHTVRAIGSSAGDTPAEIAAANSSSRDAADSVLLALLSPKLEPLGVGRSSRLAPAPATLAVVGGISEQHASCTLLTPSVHRSMVAELALPSGGITINNLGSAPASIALKRFGETFDPVSTPAAPHAVSKLVLPTDRASTGWQAQLVSSAQLATCGLRP